ncbi:MAG: PfkB family carbohydrate kinase [Endozoicomonas sp.]
MTNILCIGNATWDRFFFVDEIPSQATKYFSTKFIELGGGVAATAAVAAARLGSKVSFVGRSGQDSVGDQIKTELESWGVNTRFVQSFAGVTSSNAVVHVDTNGERQITVLRDPEMPKDPDWIKPEMLDGVDCVLCDCTWPEGAERLMTLARERSIPTVIDADLGGEALLRLLPLGSHVAFSNPALTQLSGETDVELALQHAQTYTDGTVYVTRGEKGCYWLENGELNHSPAYKVDVVDTTGAGDVFHGALAVAVAEKKSGVEAVSFASAVAALKCTKPGGRAGIPERPQLIEFMKNPQE